MMKEEKAIDIDKKANHSMFSYVWNYEITIKCYYHQFILK